MHARPAAAAVAAVAAVAPASASGLGALQSLRHQLLDPLLLRQGLLLAVALVLVRDIVLVLGGLPVLGLLLPQIDPELAPEHGADIDPLRLRGQGAEVEDVVDHGLRQGVDAVDEVLERVVDPRPDVVAERAALEVVEDEAAALGLERGRGLEPVRVARGDHFDVVREEAALDGAVAHDLLEESHAIARVHLVQQQNHLLLRGERLLAEADLGGDPSDDVRGRHPAVDVQDAQRQA
mmetsp:Transcript_8640/g.21264  ORF Transcript_8640/g.21264 Transcript_8640/m.21264 type:complete len:236 (-) Transcript_8640:735-1442(-)